MKKTLTTISALALIIAAAAGCFALYFLVLPSGLEKGIYFLSVLLLIAGFFINRLVHALLHETGHLVFGIAAGFKLYEFAIGPFRLVKSGKRLRFRFQKNKYGGMVMMTSKKFDNLYRRYFTLTLGGVVLSILTGLAYLAVVIFLRDMNFLLYSFLLPGVFASFYMIAMNVLPFENDGTYSDGAVLAGIRKRDVQTELNIVLMAIQGMLCSGKSPKDIERRYFYDVPDGGSEINAIQLKNYQYVHELDAGNIEAAIRLSDEIQEHFADLPEIYKPGILTDIFYTELVLKGDEQRARNLWYGIEKYVAHDLNVCNLRIRMAYELYVKDNPRLAIATGKTALQVKDEFIIPGIAEMEERLVGQLTEIAEARAKERDRHKVDDTLTEYKG